MAIPIDTYGKLYEIISNLKEYDSPEKLEDLKTELKFLKEIDDSNSIYIADYGDDVSEVLSSASPSNIGYVFCFPGFTGSFGDFSGSLRIIPVSTAMAGMNADNSVMGNKGFFAGAYLRDINFSNSDLQHMDLTGADLTNALLQHTQLSNSKIHNTNFCGADLTGATLPGYANTISEFKTVTGDGNWNGETTIWTDGVSLDGFHDIGAEPAEEPVK